mmetsp:Transcript_1333/g.1401  ORF Transcript_1333/g.1401 Transcript_1333/m.1401 type:complete len:570 (-) Transcript_1333:130-1839(-)
MELEMVENDSDSDDSDGEDVIEMDLEGAETLDDHSKMMSVLDDLCATPADKYRGADPHLAPTVLEHPSELQTLKTWAGQVNLKLGIRFGVAESIVDREYMEDRTLTTASYSELQSRRRSSTFSRKDSCTGQDSTSSFTSSLPESSSQPLQPVLTAADEQAPDFAFFGIFDGHNGHYVSEALQSSLYQLFGERWEEAAEEVNKRLRYSNQSDIDEKELSLSERAVTCITAACAQLDRAVLGHDLEKQRLLQAERSDNEEVRNKKVSHIKETFSFAGSTAVVMVAFRERLPAQLSTAKSAWDTEGASPPPPSPQSEGAVRLVLANVGDCRAVLSDAGTAVCLTTPHKPSMPSEKTRIIKAGGWVHRDRVNGVLAVSRSFGDIMYKTFPPPTDNSDGVSNETDNNIEKNIKVSVESKAVEVCRSSSSAVIPWSEGGGLWGAEQQVISKPETIELEVKSSHEFVVLASDGVWDVLTPEEVVNFVRRRLGDHGDCQRAAIETVSKAEARGTSDNTSVVVCALNQIERELIKRLSYVSSASTTSDICVDDGVWKTVDSTIESESDEEENEDGFNT